jgi:hypothetical protein
MSGGGGPWQAEHPGHQEHRADAACAAVAPGGAAAMGGAAVVVVAVAAGGGRGRGGPMAEPPAPACRPQPRWYLP